MSYSDYDDFDFATDDAFIQWVRFPDAASDTFWQDILKKYPDKRSAMESARKVLNSVSFQEDEWSPANKEQLKIKLLRFISNSGKGQAPVRLLTLKKALSYFGVAAALTGALFMIYNIFFQSQTEKAISYSTNAGEIRKLNLPDSSVITLNENSSLDFIIDPKKGHRVATLTGEGYFKVRGDAAAPFSVVANNITVQVLGTEFNVRSGDALVAVALQSGKIRLVLPEQSNGTGANNYLEMQPGQIIEYSETQKRITKNEQANASTYSRWKNRILVFEKTTLKEVAMRLYDNYGINLKIPEDILDQTFSARISIEDGNLDVLFKLLSESFQLNIEKENDTIYARKRGLK